MSELPTARLQKYILWKGERKRKLVELVDGRNWWHLSIPEVGVDRKNFRR
jgi:hypothetical protein